MKNLGVENRNLRPTPYIDQFLLSALSGHNTVWWKPGTNRIEEISVTNPPEALGGTFKNMATVLLLRVHISR